MDDPAQAGEARFETHPSITRSEKIWMDDGNIVIIAEKSAFRVHKSILSLHSEVFKDMFELGHPSDSLEETFEGCPTLHISDAASDFTLILEILYCGGKSVAPNKRFVLELLAMVALGRKYQITHIEESALQTLKSRYPVTLECWESLYPVRNMTFRNSQEKAKKCMHNMRIYTAAQALDLKFMLPTNSSFIFVLTPQEVFKLAHPEDREELMPTHQVLAVLTLKQNMSETYSIILADLYRSLQKRRKTCKDTASCDSGMAWLQTVLDYFTWYNAPPYNLWGDVHLDITANNQNACKSCNELVKNFCQAIKLQVWQKMGEYLEVPGWGTTGENKSSEETN